MPAIRLTDKYCAAIKLPANARQLDIFDDVVPGLALRIGATAKSFTLHCRGKRHTLGRYPALSLADARKAAEDIKNHRPVEVAPSHALTLRNVAELFFKIEGAKLRTADERRAVLERHVLSALGDRPIGEIKRSEVVAALDPLPDRIHDLSLSYLQRLFNWHAIRDEDFRTPLVRGMARGTAPRTRVLTDEELRKVWRACDVSGWYGQYARAIILTACRRSELEDAVRSEFNADCTEFTIPAQRYKTGIGFMCPLSGAAQAILKGVMAASPPNVERLFINGYVRFTSRPLVDLHRASSTQGWTLHDLRRTARSIMSRSHLGISADHAERCLGHVIGGVRGVYDQHDYKVEKRQAFNALAEEIARITA